LSFPFHISSIALSSVHTDLCPRVSFFGTRAHGRHLNAHVHG